ncbi:MAG TPA: hypothetical protein VFD05_04775 [Bacilli bacterium]|nr:hypothetical protein [Bacilli bacterium]
MNIKDITFKNIHPSQFYLSKAKLEAVLFWFNPHDLSNFAPLPLKRFGDKIILTDGHTRAYAAYLAGLDRVPFVWDVDQLNWELYAKCVAACQKENVFTIQDLSNRIISSKDYATKWIKWCEALQESFTNE